MVMLNWVRSLFRRDSKATLADLSRIKAECQERSRFEDQCFDEWWEQNVYRFPLKKVRCTTASDEDFLTPMMEAKHHKEFSEYFNRRLERRA
jgi:hypothetical protein